MSSAVDLKTTLNLPQTAFPMKANLPQTEPRRLEQWQQQDLYGRVRAARRRSPPFVLHDGPPYANGHIHLGTALNKILKDLVVRSRAMAGHDAPYVPGWDCHGLPIELQVDRDLGAKKRQMSAVEFRRACRAYAEKFVAIQRKEFERLGILGEWDAPYLTMAPSYQATIVRQLAAFAEKGLVYKAKKSVHWCISDATALAEAEIEYDEGHESPSIDVRFRLAAGERERLGLPGSGPLDAVIWTTTPWTLPANLAVSFHPDADYGLYEMDGATVVLATALKDLAAERWTQSGTAGRPGRLLGEVKGAAFEGARFRHPWIDRDSVGVLGDYVTLDTGTGVVHTAPGHGWDDYLTGVRYGLEIYCPVDERGRFTNEVEGFTGQKVFDANPRIVALLQEKGALLSSGRERHAYPICWRCKNPIIFRATEQWFVGLDGEAPTLREQALDAIGQVRWYPAWGEERIRNMIAGRPDWCISRQRLWGVPITAFYCRGCAKALLTPELSRRVADLFEARSADAWYELEASELLPPGFTCPGCGGAEFDKEKDILDVWFDSGSSHAAVLAGREDLPWPADVYLEGSDQHRGWFHSSLLIGVATRGRAPYKQVITHGFTVDAEGKKISKSLGNDVDTQKLINTYGAEVLRLWTVMVDYREDMRFSNDMITRVAESYRKIRNTCRYLLSNLDGFDPVAHALPEADLLEVDRYALARHRQVVQRIREAYEVFEFHVVYHQIVQYTASDLSAFYLDVLKDRLYCEARQGRRRRSAQTVLLKMVDDLARLMAPVLPFTTDEVWPLIPGRREESVHMAHFPTGEGPDDLVLSRWAELLDLRATVAKTLEEARAAKRIGSGLEARVRLHGSGPLMAAARRYEEQGEAFPSPLASLFIVSQVELAEGEGPLAVEVHTARGRKCERCWAWSEQVGTFDVHPGVCERCADVLREQENGR
jgi:isoleucyl-tRNA synthetase